MFIILFYISVIRAPEPPFEALEVSTTPLSINSPAQPPDTSDERKDNKTEEPSKTKVQVSEKQDLTGLGDQT